MLLIDGYNLLMAGGRKIPRQKFDGARERLVLAVDRYAQEEKIRCEIVFDGSLTAGLPHSEWLTIRFARDADAAMIEQIREERDRTALTVVSNDRAITDAARERKLKVLSVQELSLRLEAVTPEERTPDPKINGISQGEADRWMDEFGLNDPADPPPRSG